MSGHVGWLNKFNETVNKYKPNFPRIISAETYKEEYNKKAHYLSSKFNENFKKYKNFASNEIINAMPKTVVEQEN